MKYTESHEWLRVEEDGSVTIGITNYAQEQLGDVVYLELPEVDSEVESGDDAVVIESVKAAGEVKAPVSGTILAINEQLNAEPELVNSDPLGKGWFMRIKPSDSGSLNSLMDETAYEEFVKTL